MATITKEFTKNVLSALQQELGALGFKKRKAGIFALPISADVLGTVGLNMATGRGAGVLEINPVIGIRNQRIERLVAELNGDAFDELIPPTLAGNVGYLSPASRYLPFLFTESTPIEGMANQLCDAVKTHGLPFLQKLAELPALVEAMRTARFGIPFVTEYRIPTGLLLLGEHSQVAAFLAAKLDEIGTRNDPAALRYKNFAARLSGRLSS